MAIHTAMVRSTNGADLMPREEGAVRRPVGTLIRACIAIILGIWLSWMVVTDGVAALAARTGEGTLLVAMGTSRHPDTGAVLAERLLAGKQNGAAAQLARATVLVDPTNDRALRVLGLATEQLGRHDEAATIMDQAAALGWRDTPTQLWALKAAAINGNITAVMQRTDALARRNKEGALTTAVFLAAVTDPQSRAALIDSLARQPMWRGAFFASVREHLPVTSLDGIEILYRDMQVQGVSISPVEQLSYVDRLINIGQFWRARAFWVKSFKISQDLLKTFPYDANFALAAKLGGDVAVSQFEWRLNPDLAGAVDFDSEGTGSSLSLPANLNNGATIISQVVMLAPGTHDLTALVRGQATAAAAGWSITCLPSGQDLSRRLPNGADDELSHVIFDIPAQSCEAQRLSLMTRDQLDSQAVSITNIRIR